jgi:hypothetical protein
MYEPVFDLRAKAAVFIYVAILFIYFYSFFSASAYQCELCILDTILWVIDEQYYVNTVALVLLKRKTMHIVHLEVYTNETIIVVCNNVTTCSCKFGGQFSADVSPRTSFINRCYSKVPAFIRLDINVVKCIIWSTICCLISD